MYYYTAINDTLTDILYRNSSKGPEQVYLSNLMRREPAQKTQYVTEMLSSIPNIPTTEYF